jgi:hypothetical protein
MAILMRTLAELEHCFLHKKIKIKILEIFHPGTVINILHV